MGWAMFAYLPVLVGYNAAKEFGGSGVLGAIAGAMSIANPVMPLLAMYNEKQITLPITNAVFNPAAGGLLAALIAGVFFAF
jgi:PTS system sucrose-specific IIC component